MIPWCANVESAFSAVDSCPPPGEAVEMKTPAYLPDNAPDAQSWPVASQNALNCAGKLPYRVGMPNRKLSELSEMVGVIGGYLMFTRQTP
jgi:hypothetical protein